MATTRAFWGWGVPEASPAVDGADRQAMYRDYQMLGLASRQFAEILPQIESLDVPIE